jgi:hypothetical protein
MNDSYFILQYHLDLIRLSVLAKDLNIFEANFSQSIHDTAMK